MRMTRIISAFVALVLAAMLPFALTGSANAADPAAKQAKPRHEGFVSGKEIRNTNRFIAYGKIHTYKGKRIVIQRKNCGTCKWKFYKTTKTRASDGKFRTRIAPGRRGSRVCYLVKVPSTWKYRTTRFKVGCIVSR